jgi:hypothetical protein
MVCSRRALPALQQKAVPGSLQGKLILHFVQDDIGWLEGLSKHFRLATAHYAAAVPGCQPRQFCLYVSPLPSWKIKQFY